MKCERDELDLETMLREHFRWGEEFERVYLHIGTRHRYRISFRHHDDPTGKATVEGSMREVDRWRATRDEATL